MTTTENASTGATAQHTPERRRVALLHTVPALAPLFDALTAELAPGVAPYHIADESLLTDTVAHGLLPVTMRRVAAYAALAEQAGARAVLVTCSSIGPAVEAARPMAGVPLLRIDEPMAAEAVAAGPRIGVLATLGSTLTPTTALIESQAGEGARGSGDRGGGGIRTEPRLCRGAYEARLAGDPARHDRIIADTARRLAAESDVLVLAQASMATVLDALPDGDIPVPVLSSPRSGTAQLAEL